MSTHITGKTQSISLELLEKLKTYFNSRPEVLFAYLFGSQAAGTATAASDVDVAVFFRDPGMARNSELFLEILAALSELLRREVDLVVLNTAPPFFKSRIINCHQKIICRDSYREGEFITSSFQEYFDVLPYQEMGYRRIMDRLREEVFQYGRPETTG